MQIPVLIERVEGAGYRARSGEPLPLTAEGSTEADALARLRELIEKRFASGSKLVQLNVGPAEDPWAKFAGTWDPNDPFIQEWEQAVANYRKEKDGDPDSP